MCRSCAEGGRRCIDHRQLRELTIEDLRPESSPALPDVDWDQDPPSPARLYEQYEPEVAAATIQTLQQVRAAEPDITRTLTDAANSSGARMTPELLAWRVKSPQSLARKIAKKKRSRPDSPAATIAGNLTDVVRYTAIVEEHERISEHAATMAADLDRRGWTVIEAEHSFVDGNPYKGLHLLVRTRTGQVVELQVHSAASQAIKDRHHGDYELERDYDLPVAERATAHRRMVKAWAALPAPTGIDGLVLGQVAVVRKAYPNPY